ncbi:MAG: tRNA lysidine(34) synthetase TilS [Actinomycetaceae bacterium]|nr:tRNA lysidine(34) synthetase TilS [Actinomycetaceae bacterium]
MIACSRLIGANPTGAVRTVSLAVRHMMNEIDCHRWIVAYSGGADSLALAVAAADLASRRGEPLEAVTIDHGLRPESAQHAEQAACILEELGVDTTVLSVTVDQSEGVEAGARNARYDALRKRARSARAGVLLGHTMDDQAETVLLGLARGSGARSLGGMRPVIREDVTWVRPLLGVRAVDTRRMCETLNLQIVEDPTNALDGPWTKPDGSPLPRIAVRHKVIPALSNALGQDAVPALARTATLLTRDADALDTLTPDGGELDVDELATHPRAIRSRIFKRSAESAGARDLSSAHLDALDALVTHYRGQGPIHLANGVFAWREKVSQPPGKRVIRIRKTNEHVEHWKARHDPTLGDEHESL